MNKLAIIPECYIDTCLIETITSCYSQFNHQKGCTAVCKVMRTNFDNQFAVGIIDKDKKEVSYLQEFDLIYSKDSLLLHKHKLKHHYIIQIAPAVEMFFLRAAKEKKVDITQYGFPEDLKELTRVTKQVSDQNEASFKNFKKLFLALSDSTEFSRLAGLIQYLLEKRYMADSEDLKKIMNRSIKCN